LVALEKIAAQARQVREAALPERHRFRDKVVLFLRLMQVERGPQESFIQAMSRAIGITVDEILAQLRAGIDPIHEYLRKTGVLEELKRMENGVEQQ
jgi:hypothetical protein